METLNLNRLQQLSLAIEPYAEYWPDWTRSSHCFLGQKHILAAELFLSLRSYDQVAREMNVTSVEVIYTLSACISRLNLFRRIFEDWVEDTREQKTNKIDLGIAN